MWNALAPVTLSGQLGQLVPLSMNHRGDLEVAVRDGNLWELWYTQIPRPEAVSQEIERRLNLQSEQSMLPFAVLDAGGRAVGMTTYMNIDLTHQRLEIGSTWYAKHVQRTGINTECKWLLLRHAFEELQAIAVEFRTHWFNHPSRRAIERLGAKLDGVLRHHQRASDGSLRDTAVYSITQPEWAAVNTHLSHQLKRHSQEPTPC